MIDHFSIVCSDLERSKLFYDRVLEVLGSTRMLDHGVAVGYGSDHPRFWLAGAEQQPGRRENHIAFVAASPDVVRAFHATAVAAGAESLHEPRLWPEYHERYFAAFVRDPDGNNVEAVFHGGDGSAG